MRWIVHIGAPKTGSTAIQRFLFEQRVELRERGLAYPEVNLRGYGHHDLAFLLAGGGYPRWATPQDKPLSVLRDELRAFLITNTAPTLVLSSENFYLFPRPAALRRFLVETGMSAEDRISILCYLRRQDEAHVSWYNQTVKAQGNTADFETSVARSLPLWDYAAQLRPWQDEFGTEALILRDYAAVGDVRADVLDQLGIPPGTLALPPERVNERINRDLLDFQRLVNRLPLKMVWKRHYHKRLIALTAETAGQDLFDDAPFLSTALRADLNAYYAESNLHVARTFFNRNRLFAPNTLAESEGRSPVRRRLTLAKIVIILRHILAPRPRKTATPNARR